MRSLRGVLALVSAMALGLALVPAAGATVYVSAGSFTSPSPNGIAIDQATGNVYVVQNSASGVVNQYSATGAFIKSFGPIGVGVPSGVAVDPTDPDSDGDHNLYVYLRANEGERNIYTFDSGTGAEIGTPIVPSPEPGSNASTIATGQGDDDVYLPVIKTVQQIDPDSATPGVPVQTITCSTCPGTASFSTPSSVAVDSTGAIYISDVSFLAQRVMKFGAAGDAGPTPIEFETGQVQGSIGVDLATDEVFVKHFNASFETYVTAYESSGAKIADFGLGDLGPNGGVAVNSATGKVYVVSGLAGTVSMFTPIYPPALNVGAASALAQTTATLNATVNPNDTSFGVLDCHFEYGLTESYGETAPCDPDPGSGTSPVAVSAAISGLDPSSTYHFRVVAENPGGVSESDDEELTTLAQPKPTVTTEAATGLSQTKATLNAKVDAEGDNAPCKFEYGTTTAYGKTAACSVSPVTGSAATAVSTALTGLSAGTTYHYRVVATNGGGETKGNDQGFTTLADTCETNAALCPPPPVVTQPVSTTPPPGTPPVTTVLPKPKTLKCKKGFKRKTVNGRQKCVKAKKKHKKR